MRTRKKPASKLPLPAYPLPSEVTLTPAAQEDWARLTRLLPLNRGPRLLFVLVDSPVLRRRLSEHLATAVTRDGYPVVRLDLSAPAYQPLQDIFTMVESHSQARFFFLHSLERSLLSPEHRLSALADLNLHRDQISTRLACPLVIWTTDDALTDLARHTPDFIAWQSGLFTLAEPAVAIEAPYRQHLIDRFGKLTLYSATSDAPLAVDLERVFVKLTATQQRRERMLYVEPWESAEAAPSDVLEISDSAARRRFRRLDRDAIEESTVTLSLAEAIQNSPNLAVIGAPGAGKTTLLRFLALTFARRQAAERLNLEEERLPLFVTLRDLSRFLDDVIPDNAAGYHSPDVLPRFLTMQTQKIAPHLSLPADFFHERLAHGRCIVLLDGLDEVADPRKRTRVAEAVATCTRYYKGNRFVVTSRPRGYEGEAQHQLAALYASCTIHDFDVTDMTMFAQNWYAAVIRDRMGDTPEALAEARRQADDLLHTIRADERVQALAHNPLLLSVLAMVHQRGVGLPQRRAELYDECTDMLLGYWDQIKGGEAARELTTYGALTRSEKRALLEPVALWFHERGAQGLEATQEELEREIARQFIDLGDDAETAHSRAALFLRVIDERAGLLVERETGVYAFAHLTFQEYLAARAIADREDYIDYTLRHLHDPWWREVLLLEIGHLSDVRYYGRRARRLTSDLLRAIYNADSWLEALLKRDFLFAVRCLCDTGRLGVDDDLRKRLIDELIALWYTTPYKPQRQEVVTLFAYATPTVDGERIREELFRCIDNANMRGAAVAALGELGAAAAVPATLERLVALIADPDSGVRAGAGVALGRLGVAAATPATLEYLVALVADQRSMTWAAWALGQLGAAAATPVTLERLVALTTTQDSGVRSGAVAALGRLGAAAATPMTLERLSALTTDQDSGIRQDVVVALDRLGAAATPVILEHLVVLITDQDSEVRLQAAAVLGGLGAAAATPVILERLGALIADQDSGVREVAAWALGKICVAAATPMTLEHLGALIADQDSEVRRAAVTALGGLGPAAITPAILERLGALTTDQDSGIRQAAVVALGRLGAAAASVTLERLGALTIDPDSGVRWAAVVALGGLGAAAAPVPWERLVALITDQDSHVRWAAAWALGELSAASATPVSLECLGALIADPDSDVRRAAAWVLGSIEVPEELWDFLGQFWQAHLANSETRLIGNQFEHICDMAYRQLQQIAARITAQHGNRKDESHLLV